MSPEAFRPIPPEAEPQESPPPEEEPQDLSAEDLISRIKDDRAREALEHYRDVYLGFLGGQPRGTRPAKEEVYKAMKAVKPYLDINGVSVALEALQSEAHEIMARKQGL